MYNNQVLPCLKWLGGKRQLLPAIRTLLPPDIHERVYYEPFVGAGALLFDLQPSNVCIGDICENLILLYQIIRDDVDGLVSFMRRHEQNNNAEYYYSVRAYDHRPDIIEHMTPTERAARILYLCNAAYSGLYRENSSGCFNAAFGWKTNRTICDEPRLRAVHEYLTDNHVGIQCADYKESILDIDSHSFVFFDPPYHIQGDAVFSGYCKHRFDERDHIRLRDDAVMLHDRGVKVMICNADTDFIRQLYNGLPFLIHEVSRLQRVFTRKGGTGKQRIELIITTY